MSFVFVTQLDRDRHVVLVDYYAHKSNNHGVGYRGHKRNQAPRRETPERRVVGQKSLLVRRPQPTINGQRSTATDNGHRPIADATSSSPSRFIFL